MLLVPMVTLTVSVAGCPAFGVSGLIESETLFGNADRMVIVPVRAPSPLPALAVTVDSATADVKVTRATPLSSVVAETAESEPALALNTTGIPAMLLPTPSTTAALMVDDPPPDGSVVGDALSVSAAAFAAPIVIVTAFPVVLGVVVFAGGVVGVLGVLLPPPAAPDV